MPEVREPAVVHVDVRKHRAMSGCHISEVRRDVAVMLVVEVVALEAFSQALAVVFQSRCRNHGRVVIGIWSLIMQTEGFATTCLAHLENQL